MNPKSVGPILFSNGDTRLQARESPRCRIAERVSDFRTELSVMSLLGRALVGPLGQHLGHVRDIVAKTLIGQRLLAVTGLVADLGGFLMFVPADYLRDWRAARIQLTHQPEVYPIQGRPGEVLLGAEIFGLPVLSTATGRVARVTDLGLCRTEQAWIVSSVDTRNAVERLLRRHRPVTWNVLIQDRLVSIPTKPGEWRCPARPSDCPRSMSVSRPWSTRPCSASTPG